MTRVYHHHDKWEDFHAGQYARIYRDQLVGQESAAALLSDPATLYEAMSAVAREWPYATEHNLSNLEQNRRAWLGQAACCREFGLPDFVTKNAWNALTREAQNAANAVAETVIQEWEMSNAETLFG